MKNQELNPLELFFQSSSDTSNLECSEQEELENRFAEWWGNQQKGYSEEDMKQYAFQCVANFLSNNDNKVEIELVEIIIDRNKNVFEQFKNK